MIRHLAYLAPLALLGLAACNGPAQLTKAKEGECFTVVGREPGGAPKLERTECLTSAQPNLATPGPSTEVAAADGAASTATASASAVCPTAQPVCPTAAKPAPVRAQRQAARAERGFFRRDRREASRTRTVERKTTTRLGDYARVYTPDYPQPDLLGAPPQAYRDDSYQYSYRSEPEPYIPPPPPVERYERREGSAYGERRYGHREDGARREHYGHRDHPAAPPPVYERPAPPPVYAQPAPPPVYARPAPPPPPPAYAEGRGSRHAERSGNYGYSESYSSEERSSSSSSSRSSTYGDGYHCPDRCPPRRGAPVMAPMNGPHFPVDADGYLTWRGKTR